jgi:hypothetical protein
VLSATAGQYLGVIIDVLGSAAEERSTAGYQPHLICISDVYLGLECLCQASVCATMPSKQLMYAAEHAHNG